MQQAEGNGRVLVLVDSRGRTCDRFLPDKVILNALVHMGIPFAVHDTATTPLTPGETAGSAVVLVAQEHLLAGLNREAILALQQGVAQGVGLVNFDNALHEIDPGVLSWLGLDPEDYAVHSDVLTPLCPDHPVTRRSRHGELIRAQRMVPVKALKAHDPAWAPLLHAVLGKEQLITTRHLVPGLSLVPSHVPVLMARDADGGRMIQWLAGSRLWLQDFLGHGADLDDMFYHAIVWAARKPFACKPIPPFVTARIDDCSGAHDFKYVDVFNAHGYVPAVACFWDGLDERHWPVLKALQEQDKARLLTHAFSYYDLLYFNFGRGDYSDVELRARFEKEDALMKAHGIELPPVAHAHWNAMGSNILPFLKARGRLYIENPARLGEMKIERTFLAVHPYGSPRLGYDFMEEDPDMFRYFCHFHPADTRTPDFLEGDVLTWLGQAARNDVDKAVDRGTSQVRQGLNSMFFGQLVTHEQKLSVMRLDEVDTMLKGIDARLNRPDILFRPLDEIAAYLREHRQSTISSIRVEDGRLEYSVSGPGKVSQIVRRYDGDEQETMETT